MRSINTWFHSFAIKIAFPWLYKSHLNYKTTTKCLSGNDSPTTVNNYCTCILVCYKPTLLNGTLSPDGNAIVGTTTTATCADGYRIAGSSDNNIVSAVLTCGINGTWNGTVECEPKGAYCVIKSSILL